MRKLHLGIDGDGYIIAAALTDRGVDDASVGISMLEHIEGTIARFTADGAYDTRPMYEALSGSGGGNIKIVIPPKKTASVDSRATGPWCQRNEAIERIGAIGRRHWRKESGAHRQARAENGMCRYKRIIGDRLRAQHREAQEKEALIAVGVINRMTALGAGISEDCGVTASAQAGLHSVRAMQQRREPTQSARGGADVRGRPSGLSDLGAIVVLREWEELVVSGSRRPTEGSTILGNAKPDPSPPSCRPLSVHNGAVAIAVPAAGI